MTTYFLIKIFFLLIAAANLVLNILIKNIISINIRRSDFTSLTFMNVICI